jgi:hypothetical protein
MLIPTRKELVIYRVVARRPRVKGSSNSHRRDSTMAALLTTIVLAFVITNSLRVGINIYEAYMNLAGESESESEAGESEVKWTITMKVVSIFVLNIFALRDILYIELDIEYQAC